MKQLLIEESMPALKSPYLADFKQQVQLTSSLPSRLDGCPENDWQECVCWYLNYLMTHERVQEAAQIIDDAVNDDTLYTYPLITHAWVWLVRIGSALGGREFAARTRSGHQQAACRFPRHTGLAAL